METAQSAQTIEITNPPTFESLCTLLKEIAENQKETDRQLKETAADFNRRLGSLTTLFGDITEAMLAPQIGEKFEELGLYFPRANPNVRINDRVNDISFEIDIMLENGDKAVLIEVKPRLTIECINKHISRLKKMRKYAELHSDKRTFLGAVVGNVATDEVRKYALKQGFYVIEPVGANFNVALPDNQAKEKRRRGAQIS